MSTSQTPRKYIVTDETLINMARNPAIDFEQSACITRDELDALIRSVADLHGLASPAPEDLVEYDDDGSLWTGDVKIAEVAR